MTRPLLRSSLPSLLALALSACAMGNEALEAERACERSDQCLAGEVCFDGMCSSASDFAVRVTPLQGTGFVVQDFNPVSIRSGSMDLGLKAPGVLEGTVRIKRGGAVNDFADEYALSARGRSSVIPGLLFDPLALPGRKTPGFTAAVPAGIWDVTVTPKSAELPPAYAQRAVAPGDLADPEIVLAGENLLVVEGMLVRKQGVLWEPNAVPVYRLQVMDPVKGTALSQPAVQPANQPFRLQALKTGGAVVLRATPDASNPAGVLAPTKEFRSDEEGGFKSGFELGDYGSGPVEVSGTVVDASGSPLPDAEVTVDGRVRGGGTFSTKARALGGAFTIKVLPTERADGPGGPSFYTFTARPPSSSSSGKATIIAQVDDAALRLPPITCPRKFTLAGLVVSSQYGAGDTPLGGVQVSWEGNPAARDPGVSKGDAITAEDGTFTAEVEPGTYRVVARPGADKKLPWASVVLTASASTRVTIQVSEPREVYGSVSYKNREGTATPIPSAIVTVYRLPSAGANGESAPPVLYEALTDSLGQFRAILPRGQPED